MYIILLVAFATIKSYYSYYIINRYKWDNFTDERILYINVISESLLFACEVVLLFIGMKSLFRDKLCMLLFGWIVVLGTQLQFWLQFTKDTQVLTEIATILVPIFVVVLVILIITHIVSRYQVSKRKLLDDDEKEKSDKK